MERCCYRWWSNAFYTERGTGVNKQYLFAAAKLFQQELFLNCWSDRDSGIMEENLHVPLLWLPHTQPRHSALCSRKWLSLSFSLHHTDKLKWTAEDIQNLPHNEQRRDVRWIRTNLWPPQDFFISLTCFVPSDCSGLVCFLPCDIKAFCEQSSNKIKIKAHSVSNEC